MNEGLTDQAEHEPSLLKVPVLGLLLYWFLYVLVAPVTIYDSHVYNMARLLIIEKGGFFGNHAWNFFPQICYPWTFDAVHLPFLFLGTGFDLPSFLCLLGLLVVVHRLVARQHGGRVAWCCDLALLALPTLVYQATSTKNDLIEVFCVAVWFYALHRWQERQDRIYLFWMALALAFAAGAKLSGPPVVALLTLYSLWRLRGLPRRGLLAFVGMLGVCFLLFGSTETYLNNYLLFKRPLGPPEDIEFHRNIDGVAGGVANFIRYFFGNMNVGLDAANPRSPVAGWVTDGGRATLHFVGLDNVGYRRDFDDAKFVVLKTGLEAASDYGPAGALALLTALYLFVGRTPRDPLWKIAACGLAALAEVCLTVGWMPWNDRFLVLPFVLFTLAFVLYALRAGPHARLRRVLLVTLLLYSSVVYPLHSLNRKPSDLWPACSHREALATSERPMMSEIVDDLQARVRAGQGAPLLMTAGVGAWTYDILNIEHLDVLPTPTLNRQTLAAAQARTKADHLLVLTLEAPLDPALEPELRPLQVYPESNNVLYEWRAGGFSPGEAAPAAFTRFAEGWYGEENSPDGRFRWMSPQGNLTVSIAHAGTLVLEVRLRSIVPGNGVDLLTDGQPAASVTLPGTDWQPCVLRAPVSAGVHHLVLRSHRPGEQPPGDNRVLAVCVKDLQARLE